jgi:hypothetical protein
VFEEVSYSSNKWAMICKGNLCLSLCLCVCFVSWVPYCLVVFVLLVLENHYSLLQLLCHLVLALCLSVRARF